MGDSGGDKNESSLDQRAGMGIENQASVGERAAVLASGASGDTPADRLAEHPCDDGAARDLFRGQCEPAGGGKRSPVLSVLDSGLAWPQDSRV